MPSTGSKELLFEHLRECVGNWYERIHGVRTPHMKAIEFHATGAEKRSCLLLGSFRAEYMQRPPLAILDAGCGFGSIAVFLAWQWPDTQVLATDLTERFFSCGREVAEKTNLRNIKFEIQEASENKFQNEFDLVISCNVLNYMTSYAQLEAVLVNLAASTRSKGRIIIHTPHFWSIREPFTLIPFLNFLPKKIRNTLAHRSRRRTSLDDVRHPSLREITRILARQGLKRVITQPTSSYSRLFNTHFTAWYEKK